MDPLLQIGLAVLASVISAAVVSVMVFRIAFAEHKGMDTAREKGWNLWREDTNKRLDAHAEKIANLADHESRIARLELRVNGK